MYLTGAAVVTMGSDIVIRDNIAESSGAAIHAATGVVTFGRCVHVCVMCMHSGMDACTMLTFQASYNYSNPTITNNVAATNGALAFLQSASKLTMGDSATITGGKPFDLYLSAAGSCECANPNAEFFYDCPTGPCTTSYNQLQNWPACVVRVMGGRNRV